MKIRLLLLYFIQAITAYKTIIDVLSEDERFSTLVGHLQTHQLIPKVNKLQAGTLFAPDNKAFEKSSDTEITTELLLYHFLNKGILTSDFYHGQLKETLCVNGYLGSDPQRIKMTVDGHKVYVNQARVVTSDIQVNNDTVIQVIDRVLEPPKLLGDIINTINPAIDSFMKMVKVDELLREKTGFTVFVSTKENPLSYYNSIESSYLTSKYGKTDLTLFLKYTIIDKPIYLDEFTSGKTTFKSITGDSLTITSTKKGEAMVNDLKITQSDVLAGNGVIHQIEDVFKPDSITFNTRKYLYGLNATHMNELFDNYNLSYYIDQEDNKNYTLLVPPSDTPLPSIPVESWLKYHVIQGLWPQDTLYNKELLLTEFRSSELGNNYQRVPIYTENDASEKKSSILFDHSRTLGDPINIKNTMIYQVSEPLSLPGDFLGKLVSDLDFSTFIATLYVSKVADDIKNTSGITLFVPTNDAFKELGLIAKYLVHSSAKTQLQSVLKYHAIPELLYYQDLKEKVHEVTTLSNSTLRISPIDDHSIIVGRPDDDTKACGIITKSDMLVSNGVIHKISRVQIPREVRITNQDILVGIESNTLMILFEKAQLLDEINKKNVVVLAPTEKAFAHIDIQALLGDPYQLERVAKMHILPISWQANWDDTGDVKKLRTNDYSTLLSSVDKVSIKEVKKGTWQVEVKDGGDEAHVLGLGQTSFNGGIIAIDTVLIPIRRGIFGLPWAWSVVCILTVTFVTGGLLSLCGFFGYKVYNRRRLGYRPLS
ncbi:hypothetical protein G6F46_008369 [Rhizopus delemar]|uniref:FAS1 domain-containing protein n=2 Tax=Rhizopus TaxID=4842 RepID=A0A9P6YVS1_9FUNG|nr:hypothetical protein G6F55_007406 [Rhizopus delemar]KAG1537837.1 hypothetical protein G6F51_010131 [Rhizopus arrhizus]KAG1492015.1 hypothetical protein G6F54_009608 [Rhizopus delemar]KAG1510549.1 hypothetical protein G6F53_006600 [Rhizopus delemar]KAG1550151.1 hypothetical protein G6F49_009382 [Rhizopus delemar]